MVLQLVPPAEGHLDVHGIELSPEGMYAEEGAVEPMAEPVAPLGVDHPMLEILAVGAASELPGIKSVENLERMLFAGTYLQANVGGGRNVIEQIGLQCNLLCTCFMGSGGQKDGCQRHQ